MTNEDAPRLVIEDALRLVIACAAAWGENCEEGFSRRLTGDESDDECMLIAQQTDPDNDTEELSNVIEVRNLWAAIRILSAILPNDQQVTSDPTACQPNESTITKRYYCRAFEAGNPHCDDDSPHAIQCDYCIWHEEQKATSDPTACRPNDGSIDWGQE